AHHGARGQPVADRRLPERGHEAAGRVGSHHRGADDDRRHLRHELPLHARARVALGLSGCDGRDAGAVWVPVLQVQAVRLAVVRAATTVARLRSRSSPILTYNRVRSGWLLPRASCGSLLAALVRAAITVATLRCNEGARSALVVGGLFWERGGLALLTDSLKLSDSLEFLARVHVRSSPPSIQILVDDPGETVQLR